MINLSDSTSVFKLIIVDFDTINELNSFVRVKDSYAAEEGNNDDVLMTLVFFSWLTAQSYFKEITNVDIREKLNQERNLYLEEDMAPVGFLDDEVYRQEKYVEGDDLWTITESPKDIVL